LNFGNPERSGIMGQIVESIEGLAEACRAFEVPVTGGNVSLYNETLGKPIFPTPVVGIVGTLPTAPPLPLHFQKPGSTIVLLGGLGAPEPRELGGTQYAKAVLDTLWGKPPSLDMGYEKRVQTAVRELVRERAVESAHDLGEGGLAVALAECSFGPDEIGADIRVDSNLAPELLLFHEGPSRILVSALNPERVFAVARKNNVQAVAIGVTLVSRLVVRNQNETLIDAGVSELYDLWRHSLEHLLQTPVLVNTNV
jgi:phosphoribosylformylglycinamidine synthase